MAGIWGTKGLSKAFALQPPTASPLGPLWEVRGTHNIRLGVAEARLNHFLKCGQHGNPFCGGSLACPPPPRYSRASGGT